MYFIQWYKLKFFVLLPFRNKSHNFLNSSCQTLNKYQWIRKMSSETYYCSYYNLVSHQTNHWMLSNYPVFNYVRIGWCQPKVETSIELYDQTNHQVIGYWDKDQQQRKVENEIEIHILQNRWDQHATLFTSFDAILPTALFSNPQFDTQVHQV